MLKPPRHIRDVIRGVIRGGFERSVNPIDESENRLEAVPEYLLPIASGPRRRARATVVPDYSKPTLGLGRFELAAFDIDEEIRAAFVVNNEVEAF